MAISNHKLAVLIDADNAQASICNEILSEVSKFGISSIKRAYGDWTTTNLKGWKDVLHKHAIQPMQQFSYTQGKNSTDSALIIDAMDILHAGNLEGFCIVSSDSDFTRLANRIRESGLVVYGFGEKKTPDAFVSACDKFIFTEILKDSETKSNIDESSQKELKQILISAIKSTSRDDGWAPLSLVGTHITKTIPSFDARNYGFEKLGKLVKSQPYVELQERAFGDGSSNMHIYIREK